MTKTNTFCPIDTLESNASLEFDALLDGPIAQSPPVIDRINHPVIGTLLALSGDGGYPLVCYPGQPGTAALCARAIVDLHGAHMGASAVLIFENGDPLKPIVVGCLHGSQSLIPDLPGAVDLVADGTRLVVSAKDQLVLRCGKASITLTQAGKIIIEGAYISNRSTGVLRLKGGSVQIN